MRLDMAVFAWGYMLHEQDASPVDAKLQCWKGRVGETHIGVSRGTSNSLALGSEIKIRNHPIGRATDIFPCSGCFIAGLSKWAIYTIRAVRNFPYHKPSQALWVHPLRGHLGYGSMSYNLGNVGIFVWYLLFYGGAVL